MLKNVKIFLDKNRLFLYNGFNLGEKKWQSIPG